MTFIALFISIVAHGLMYFLLGLSIPDLSSTIQFKNSGFVISSIPYSGRRDPQSYSDKITQSTSDNSSVKNTEGFASLESSLTMDEIVRQGNRLPPYPREAMERGWQGTVELKLMLNGDGSVINAAVIRSSGFPILDLAALETSRGWVFPVAKLRRVLVAPIKFIIES